MQPSELRYKRHSLCYIARRQNLYCSQGRAIQVDVTSNIALSCDQYRLHHPTLLNEPFSPKIRSSTSTRNTLFIGYLSILHSFIELSQVEVNATSYSLILSTSNSDKQTSLELQLTMHRAIEIKRTERCTFAERHIAVLLLIDRNSLARQIQR